MPPKSILKTSLQSTHCASLDARHHDLALYHANLIQQQKDTQAQIYTSIEELIDIPSNPAANPAHPSASDTTFLKQSLKPFTVSNYEELIKERNINERCGYPLCPRKNRKENTTATHRILTGRRARGGRFRVVKKEELELWCSEECMQRAMYIKVQLSEVPAWERNSREGRDVKLLSEVQSKEQHEAAGDGLMSDMQDLTVGEENDLSKDLDNLVLDPGNPRTGDISDDLQNLALERGDPKKNRDGRVEVKIFEKANSGTVTNPPHAQETYSDSIEGYRPKSKKQLDKLFEDDDDDDDIMDHI